MSFHLITPLGYSGTMGSYEKGTFAAARIFHSKAVQILSQFFYSKIIHGKYFLAAAVGYNSPLFCV